MGWTRPSHVRLPTVWRRFRGRRSAGGAGAGLPSFIVQDVPEELFPAAVDFMCEYFVLDEPLCKAVDMCDDKETMESIRAMWFKALAERVSLICLLDQEGHQNSQASDQADYQKPVIVGVNIMTISTKDHDDMDLKPGSLFDRVIKSVMHITHEVDAFSLYGVTEYLGAIGLSVSRDYRGQNIGAEILKARIPLCKALGLKLTATVFTAVESQVLATKCGFHEIGEVSYQFLADTYVFPVETINTKTMKYMALAIS